MARTRSVDIDTLGHDITIKGGSSFSIRRYCADNNIPCAISSDGDSVCVTINDGIDLREVSKCAAKLKEFMAQGGYDVNPSVRSMGESFAFRNTPLHATIN